MTTPAIEPTATNGHAPFQPPARYLLDRGFPEWSILEVGWRIEPVGASRCPRYGLPPEAAEARVWVIPYRHRNGSVAFERLRLIDEQELERFGGGKYRQPGGRALALYDPFGVLLEGPLDAALLIEGEANAIAAHVLVPDLAIIGLPGQTALTVRMAEELGHVPVVYLWIDRHDPGAEENAQRIAERLKDAGVDQVLQLPAPPGRMDANDLLREDFEHSRQFVDDMLRAATPVDPPIDDDWPLMPKPTPPRFPVDALPATIAAFVNAVAAQTQTPADMAAMGVLGVLSAVAMGATIDCGGWDEEALALYILVISPSGDHKSTVLKKVAAPLYRLEQEARAEAKATRAQQDTHREMLKARREVLVKQGSKLEQEDEDWAETQVKLERVSTELAEASEYVEPRLLTDDATPEALAKLMARHANGIAVVSAESAIINNLLGHYSDQGKANLHIVCKAVNGEGPISVDRGGAEPLFIARPLLAITLFAQPHVLKGILGHGTARDQGLVGRVVYADLEPATTLGRRDYRQPPPKVPHHLQEAWAEIVHRVKAAWVLTELTEPPFGARLGSSVSSVSTSKVGDLTLTLSPSSQQLLAELLMKLEPRQLEGGDLRAFADWLSRHHGRIARIAALLHLTEHSPERPIGERTMRSALRIGEYLFEHMLIALSTPDPIIRRALAWLAKHDAGDVSQRELQRGPLNGRAVSDAAAELAEALVRIGALRPVPVIEEAAPSRKGGRRASPRYDINPRLRALGRSDNTYQSTTKAL